MSRWLQDPGAWIAIGISVLFLVVGWVMHRVILRVLRHSPPPVSGAENPLRFPNPSDRTETHE